MKIAHKIWNRLRLISFIIGSFFRYAINRSEFRTRKNVAFSLKDPNYKPFFLPLLEVLIQRPDYHLFSFGSAIGGVPRYSRLLQPFIKESLIILCADTFSFIKKANHKRVQMFHGFGSFGAIWGEVLLTDFDVIFLTGPYMKKQLSEPYYQKLISDDNKSCHEVGYVKMDLFKDLHNLQNSKTIFYGPTYHVEFSSIFSWLETIFEVANTMQFDLIIKLHPYLLKKHNQIYSGGVDWEQEIRKLSNVYEIEPKMLAVDCSIDDQREAFATTSHFLTDASSIGYEYMLATGRPIIFIDDKIKIPVGSNKEEFLEYFEVKQRGLVGPVVRNGDELRQALDTSIEDHPYENAILDATRQFAFNLGRASHAAQKAIDVEFNRLKHELSGELSG